MRNGIRATNYKNIVKTQTPQLFVVMRIVSTPIRGPHHASNPIYYKSRFISFYC